MSLRNSFRTAAVLLNVYIHTTWNAMHSKEVFLFPFHISIRSELGFVSLLFASAYNAYNSTIIKPNLGNTFLIIRQFLVIQQQILGNHWFILNLGDMQISGYLLLFTLITGSRLGDDVDEYFRSGVPLL